MPLLIAAIAVGTVAAGQQCEYVKPVMGWNSYDSTLGNAGITEQRARSSAAWLSKELLTHGYDTFVLDSGWFGADSEYGAQTIDGFGRLVPNTTRYPSAAGGAGFAPLATYVHSLGMRFGFWTMGGIPREAVLRKLPIEGTNWTAADAADLSSATTEATSCPWNKWLVYGSRRRAEPGAEGGGGATASSQLHPAAVAYYDSVARLYASWGADFIKMDCVFGGQWGTRGAEASQFAQSMMRALPAARRESFVLSLSPGNVTDIAPQGAAMASAAGVRTTMARVTGDFWDHWSELFAHFETAAASAPLVSGAFRPDLDMLPIGWISHTAGPPRYAGFSLAEQRTLVTQWVMARAPLIWGGAAQADRVNATTWGLIANDEVLNVSATSCANRQLRRDGNVSVWAAQGPGGFGAPHKYVALLNLGEAPIKATLSLGDAAMPGGALPDFDAAGKYVARDLWFGRDMPVSGGTIDANLMPHASALFAVRPV